MRIQFTLLFLIVLFPLAFANGQQIRFESYTIENGLSQNTVYDIHQDSLGFVWIATQNGLNRFDGLRFKVYNHNNDDSTSITNNYINVITPCTHGNLWIGTLQGASIYVYEKDHFKNDFSRGKGFDLLQKSAIEDIFVSDSSDTWFGGDKGLFHYKTGEKVEHFPFLDSLSVNNSIYKITGLTPHKLLLATTKGPFVFDTKTQEFSPLRMEARGLLKDKELTYITDLFKDDKGVIWMAATGDGIVSYDPGTKKAQIWSSDSTRKPVLKEDLITTVTISPNGKIWAGSYSGLQIINPADSSVKQFKHKSYQPQSIGRGDVSDIYFDEAGNAWIGSNGGGVSMYAPSKNQFHLEQKKVKDDSSIPSNIVRGLLKQNNGTVWVATDGGGLQKRIPAENVYKTYKYQSGDPHSLNSNYVLSLARDYSDRIWVGTYGWGVNVYREGRDDFIRFSEDEPLGELNDKTITHILQSSDSTYWFATMSGVYYYESIPEKGVHLYATDSLKSIPNNKVWDIYEDSKGDTWIGTMKGIARLSPDKKIDRVFQRQKNDSLTLPSESVNCFAEDHKNRLWLGTDAGICRLDRERDVVIPYKDKFGLPEGIIYKILHHQGVLWISTNYGLYKYDIKNEFVRQFSVNDGLQSREFNSGAAYKSADNEMFFGGIKGYNRFYPDSISISDYNPQVNITNFQLFNKDVEVGEGKSHTLLEKPVYLTDKINLSYKDQVLTFEFASMDMASPEDIHYKYMMEGFDNSWIAIEKNKPVTYTNLPPGNYTFRVQGTNADGVWSNNTANLKIEISPPFYKTLSFTIALIFIIILLIFFIIKIRERRLNKEKFKLEKVVHDRTLELTEKNRELEQHRNNLEELVRQRTSDLQKAKDKAEESDRLKTAFLANMSHEIRTPMNAILGFSDILTDPDLSEEEMEYNVNLIHANTNRLLQLIDDIVDLARIESGELVFTSEDIEINSLMIEVSDEAAKYLENKNKSHDIEIKKQFDSELVAYIHTDPNRLKQVLRKLFQNAIKFTERGAVTIGYRIKNEHIEFFVEDTGIGIPKDKQEVVFHRFRQLDDSHTRKFGGTGLGLALVKMLVAKIGSKIQLHSEYGKGSRFFFSLPLMESAGNEKASRKEKEPVQVPNLSGKVIIVAEDTESNRMYLVKLLKKTRATIVTAHDGRLVYDEVIKRQGKVDLILMDIEMPLMDGAKATEKIKKKYPGIIVIAQTVYLAEKDIKRYYESGCDAHLEKPILKNNLYSILSKTLRN